MFKEDNEIEELGIFYEVRPEGRRTSRLTADRPVLLIKQPKEQSVNHSETDMVTVSGCNRWPCHSQATIVISTPADSGVRAAFLLSRDPSERQLNKNRLCTAMLSPSICLYGFLALSLLLSSRVAVGPVEIQLLHLL